MMTRSRSQTGASPIGAVVGVAAVLAVVLGVFLVQQSASDTDPAGTDQPTSGETSTSDSPADEETSQGAPDDEAWLAEAVVAAKDGYPAFVPAEVPAGWSVDGATYAPDTGWHMDLTSPSGATVSLDQRSSGKVAGVVTSVLNGAEPAGTVNLRRWGTGTWQAFQSGDGFALGKGLAGTVVVVSGATDEDEVVEITKQLLTAETAVNVGDGSDG